MKIKIFSWQMLLDRLPSALQIATRQGPSNGKCALCSAEEDAAHIFFTCLSALFMWSVLRQVLGRSWCPASLPQFFAILSGFSGQARRLLWIYFVAQSWALWHVRNKLAIEAKVINHPADIIFKTLLFLQLWIPTLKLQDKEGARWMLGELRKTHVMCRPSR